MDKKQKKILMIAAPIAVVVLLIGGGLFSLLGSSTTVAALNIEEGKVQVDTGSGWADAQDGMELSISDKVKTLDGTAILVLYESIIVQLEKNTEIAIAELSKKNVKLNQNTGSTWNKFTAIMGVQNFEVETPNTVATVRGTEFWDDQDSIGVVNGTVDARMGNKMLTLGARKKALLSDEFGQAHGFDDSDITRAIEKKKIIIKTLKNLRQQELQKHNILYSMIKKTKGWTDADVYRYMERLDNGEFNEDDLKAQAKLPAESIDRFVALTKEIKKAIKELKELENYTPTE